MDAKALGGMFLIDYDDWGSKSSPSLSSLSRSTCLFLIIDLVSDGSLSDTRELGANTGLGLVSDDTRLAGASFPLISSMVR